ncbi:MAG: KEOPS complex subunit Cgi121 [Halobacterium sp.]
MRVVEGVAHVEDVDAFVAALGDVGDEYGCAVQAFDADYVADRAHLEAAVEHANRAFERGENVASDRAVEVLLYAAGRRQIRRALEMGVGEGESEVVVVVDGNPARDAGEVDEPGAAAAVADVLDAEAATLGGDEATLRSFFDVSDAEFAVVDDLSGVVRERVALLDVEK